MTLVQTLTRYKTWADAILLDALAKLDKEALLAPQPIVFGSIVRTANHVLAMDEVWRSNLQGTKHGYETRNPPTHPPLDTLRAQQTEIDEWYEQYADSLTSKRLGEPVDFTFIGGGVGRMTREAILLHVVNHGTYHRGHISDMMYRVPANPPTTDLPVFLTQYANSSKQEA